MEGSGQAEGDVPINVSVLGGILLGGLQQGRG